VRVDPDRPPGLYVKEADAAGSPVRYYRRGSAASALGPEVLDGLDLAGAALVHVTGITAALSDSCLALLRAVLARPRAALVSFDLNWRPALWRDRDPGELRALLPGPATLVVKHGARGATAVEGGVPTFQEGLRVEVVEPVGAGDAFAAGYLAAHLAGEPPARRLRAGHLQAASALLTREDVGEPLPAEVTAPLLGADPRTWAAAHLRRRR
jgi:2-dehydro-3-deoxygluconokinase